MDKTRSKPVFFIFPSAMVNTSYLHLLADADDTDSLLYCDQMDK
jgi:hypothetical protein